MANFAERLRELRKKNGVSQKSLATAIKITERGYQDLEYGKFKPSHDTIIALADYFDVSTDYLLGRTVNPNVIDHDITAVQYATELMEKLSPLLLQQSEALRTICGTKTDHCTSELNGE